MLDASTPKGRIVAAALKLASQRPWREVTLKDIAAAAGVPLVDLKGLFASKSAIFAAFIGAVDDEVLRQAPPVGPGQSPRDLLFDVVMSRLDALQPHKAAVKSMLADAATDPSLIRPFLASQHWMLAAAGIGTDGFGGAARVAGLGQLYASVMRTWLDDDDPGLARTMAALDRRLRRGESAIKSVEDAVAGAARIARDLPGVLRDTFRRWPAKSHATPAGPAPEPEGNPAPPTS